MRRRRRGAPWAAAGIIADLGGSFSAYDLEAMETVFGKSMSLHRRIASKLAFHYRIPFSGQPVEEMWEWVKESGSQA